MYVHAAVRNCPIIMSDYFIGHAIKIPGASTAGMDAMHLVVSLWMDGTWEGGLNRLCKYS